MVVRSFKDRFRDEKPEVPEAAPKKVRVGYYQGRSFLTMEEMFQEFRDVANRYRNESGTLVRVQRLAYDRSVSPRDRGLQPIVCGCEMVESGLRYLCCSHRTPQADREVAL